MYLITVIGATGQGKSPFIRKYIESKNCFVFDIQNEYGGRTKYSGQQAINLPANYGLRRSRYIGSDKMEFVELCSVKRNTICVFEEATMFFEGKIEQPMRRLIFSKAHSGNIYILVFHSINSVPPRIMEGSDYVVLFKTLDERKNVKIKYESLLNAFDKLKKMPNQSSIKIKMI